MEQITPAKCNRSLTLLLDRLLADTGFSKKRIGRLQRKTKECEQFALFYFTRERGRCGYHYGLTMNLGFRFADVDKLTSEFQNEAYAASLGTAILPFYTLLPDSGVSFRKYDDYCAEEPLDGFAEMLSKDFREYALPFYEKYDTLHKLEAYLDDALRTTKRGAALDAPRLCICRSRRGGGYYSCFAAVLCVLGEYEKCRRALEETAFPEGEVKERIIRYLSERGQVKKR